MVGPRDDESGGEVPMRSTGRTFAAIGLVAVAAVAAARGADEKGAKLADLLNDDGVHASWIYSDLDRGLAEAKRTGRPLLAVFR
jgi:hypothetical protein